MIRTVSITSVAEKTAVTKRGIPSLLSVPILQRCVYGDANRRRYRLPGSPHAATADTLQKMEPYVHDAVLDMHMAREKLLAALGRVAPEDWSRYVPYGGVTMRDLLAHLAGADQAWAVAAQGLLKGETLDASPASIEEAKAARARAIERGRTQSIDDLREEMDRRRKLLLSLYELLEPRHLALALPAFGDRHNSVRERIWRGYHDRLHAADVQRALRLQWHPQGLTFPPELHTAVEALSTDATLYVIHSVDPAQWGVTAPNSAWTYRQLLAHIATGDWVLQGHLRHVIEHNSVADWPDVDAGNDRLIHERAHSTDAALAEEYLSMRHETLRLLSELRAKHLSLPIVFRWEPSPNEHTILEYITMFERHDRTHREQLRPAMRYVRALRGA